MLIATIVVTFDVARNVYIVTITDATDTIALTMTPAQYVGAQRAIDGFPVQRAEHGARP